MVSLLYRGNKKLPYVFTENQINEIFNQILISKDYLKNEWGEFMRYRDIALIGTMYILGLRPREACCLKFKDFDFRNMTVRIDGQNNKVHRDGVLPIPQILAKIYQPYLNLPRHRFWKGSKYLFPSFSNAHISPGRAKHTFREKVLKPLGLWEMPEHGKVPRIRLYTLRHSRASHILQKQVKETGKTDIFTLANFMRHSDIRSTMVYLHTDNQYMEYLRQQIEI